MRSIFESTTRRALIIPAALAIWAVGCAKKELPADMLAERQVVTECHRGFYGPAAERRLSDTQAALSQKTREWLDAGIGQPEFVFRSWTDFMETYGGMTTQNFIERVEIQGDKAVVIDAIGGKTRCVREGERWRIDLAPQ